MWKACIKLFPTKTFKETKPDNIDKRAKNLLIKHCILTCMYCINTISTTIQSLSLLLEFIINTRLKI